MEGNEDSDTLATSVDLPRDRNLRFTPHPISADPRSEHGYEHEHILENSHFFAARIPRLHSDVFSTNGEDAPDHTRMKCCCGRSDCAYLEHNNAALGGLERDLETAARLGQALLSRHESYINESQAEQSRLSTCISELEAERLSLQNANEKMVAENRDLLHKLEHLNGSLANSDLEVKRLESLLLDCELEVKRLNNLVRRTQELDNKVHEMEYERQTLNRQMDEGQDEVRSTLARWRESERKVRELEEDVRRIEWEARLDREKHEEIVARLERERAFERELGGAEGRLKGAAAIQSLDKNAEGSKNVVTHFVRDILQDNANLQAGIAELRQLLQSSNEEVQNLREQIMLHQPLTEDSSLDASRKSVSLEHDLQLDATSPKQNQREVHVHHHYHAKPTKVRTTAIRKPIRRRTIMPGNGSTSDSSAPSTPVSRPQRYNSSPVIPLSLQPQQHHPQSQSNRWSMQSTATMSSVLSSMPSSPRSYYDRGGFIFDRIEQGEESSRPTSPESVGSLLSPGPGQWKFRMDKRVLDACEEEEDQKPAFEMSPLVESKPIFDANELPTPPDSEPLEIDKELTPKPSIMLQSPTLDFEDSIAEPSEPRPPDTVQTFESEAVQEKDAATEVEPELETETTLDITPEATPKAKPERTVVRKSSKMILNDIPEIRPTLARKGSHETLVSISGMDIHIAQRGSPTATLELLHSHFAHTPAQARKMANAQPVASVTEYTATSTPMSITYNQPRPSLRHVPSSIEALSGIVVPKPRAARTSSQTGAIGRLGGWVRGKWGIAPMKSSGDLRSVSLTQESRPPVPPIDSSQTTSLNPESDTGKATATETDTNTPASAESETTKSISVPSRPAPNPLHANVDPAILFAGRSPGINQPGIIPGFRVAVMNKRTPSQVMASVIDEEGLKEGLAE